MLHLTRKPLRILLILMLVCGVATLQAQQATLTPEEALLRPTPMPDRIVLTWNDDPSTSQAVTWRTDTSMTKGIAELSIADPGPAFDDTERDQTVQATTTELATNLWTANYHSATFRNLEPDTLYVYRVGDGANWSEWFHFRTANNKPEPFSFIYIGDVQNRIRSVASRTLREAFRAAPDAGFFVFAGDLVSDARDDRQWGEFFGVGSWLYAMTPMIPATGNHEYRKDAEGINRLTQHWRAQFTLPEHGPEGIEEHAYYIDYQGVRIVALASSETGYTPCMIETQADWLDEVLSDNPNKWTILVFHHPVFSVARGRDNPDVRNAWKPIIDKHRVDLVLTGHDHTYARSGLEEATIYASSVAGAKMYQLARRPWMTRAGELTQFFQIIRINGDKLAYEARTATGRLYDAFELRKQPGEANILVDHTPADVPERIRPLDGAGN